MRFEKGPFPFQRVRGKVYPKVWSRPKSPLLTKKYKATLRRRWRFIKRLCKRYNPKLFEFSIQLGEAKLTLKLSWIAVLLLGALGWLFLRPEKVIAHPPPYKYAFMSPIEPVSSTLEEKQTFALIPYIKPPCGTETYVRGQCTLGVASWTCVPFYMGNASRWDEYARANGFEVSNIPVKGMVAQKDGGAGHVGLVLDTRPGEFLLKEMNYDYRGSVREVWKPIGNWEFIRF